MREKSMRTRLAATLLGLLMLSPVCVASVSCGMGNGSQSNPTDSLQSGADSTQIPDIPDLPDTGTDTAPVGEVPAVPVGTNTVEVTAAQLLKLIEEGTIAENGD